ncbi:MAG: hypothetical protein BGO28_04340 [Alphaproteobacteria bacterium 43-37]|nr:MAG: hypothetical protein BGO28_04340 [Alphaproteobacteria bacterium 43-37]
MAVSLDTKVTNTPLAQMKGISRSASTSKPMANTNTVTNNGGKAFSCEVNSQLRPNDISAPDSSELGSNFDSNTQAQPIENEDENLVVNVFDNPAAAMREDIADVVDAVETPEAGVVVLANCKASEANLNAETAHVVKPLGSFNGHEQDQIAEVSKVTEPEVALTQKEKTVEVVLQDKAGLQEMRVAQLSHEAQAEENLQPEFAKLINKEQDKIQDSSARAAEMSQDVAMADIVARNGQVQSSKHDSGNLRIASESHELQGQKQELFESASVIQVLAQESAEGQQDRHLEQRLDALENEHTYQNHIAQDLAPENIIAMKFAMSANRKDEALPVAQPAVYQSRHMNPLLQVADGIHHVMKQGQQNRLHVQLLPETLGAIDIVVDMAETGKLSILVQAEKSSTYDLLRLDAANMHQALTNAGLNVGLHNLEFSYMNSSEQSHSNGHNPTNRRHSHSGEGFEVQEPVLDEPLIHVDPNFVRIRA